MYSTATADWATGHSLWGTYPSAQVQSVYSTAVPLVDCASSFRKQFDVMIVINTYVHLSNCESIYATVYVCMCAFLGYLLVPLFLSHFLSVSVCVCVCVFLCVCLLLNFYLIPNHFSKWLLFSLDFDIILNKFELQSCYNVHFRTNALWETYVWFGFKAYQPLLVI